MSIPFTDTDLALDGGDVTVIDNGEFIAGSSSDLRFFHDGTNSNIISKTGDFVLDNTNVTGSTIMKLGTNTSATDFQIQNNSTAAKLTVNGAGDVTIGGTIINPTPFTERRNSTSLNVSHNTTLIVTFNTIILERGITYSGGTFTIPVDGIYAIEHNGIWSGNSTNLRLTEFLVNGTDRFAQVRVKTANTDGVYMGGSDMINLSAGDEIVHRVFQNSFATLTYQSRISIMRIG